MYDKEFLKTLRQWQSDYDKATRTLKERKETFETDSGIPVKRAYSPLDVRENHFEDIGFPGVPPYTRGIYPTMYRGRLWTSRLFSGFGTPEDTNDRWKLLYKEGERGFSAAMDALSLFGFDPDDPVASSEVGKTGVPLYSIDSMFALTDGLPIDKLSVALVCGPFTSAPLSAMYFNMAQAKGYDLKSLMGTVQNDILTYYIGVTPVHGVAPPHILHLACDLIEWCATDNRMPRWTTINFTGYNYREGGIDAVQELGFVFANAIDHIDKLLERGLSIEQFVNRMAFHLASHKDFFEEIAKFRAARRIWYKLITEKYKCGNPKAAQFKFHVQTAGSSLTVQIPKLNIARTAIQGLTAVLGGCQSMHTNAYDEGYCLPSEEAAILAIRTQQLIEDETNVTHVIDPLAGSYYVESLTDEIEKRVWDYLETIGEKGGITACLETGWLYKEMRDAFNRRRLRIESQEEIMIGLNKHREEPDMSCEVFRTNSQSTDIECERLRKLKEKRHNQRLETLLSKLKTACEKGDNVMPIMMDATREGATIGEVTGVYRDVWGIWEPPVSI